MAVRVPTKGSNQKEKEVPLVLDQEGETPPEFENFEVDPSFKIIEPSLVPFPAKNIEKNKAHLFYEWRDGLTEADWNHLTMLLYREYPFIDRQRVNPKAQTNIEIFGSAWNQTSQKFLTEHGSGIYKIIVNDSNKAVKGKGGLVGIARFEVSDPDYPPVFVLEELVPEHPSNKGITAKLVAEGKLNLEGNIMATQGGTDNAALLGILQGLIHKLTNPPPAPPKDNTMDNVTSMFTKTHETAMNMLKDQVKSDDPDKLVKMLAALKEMMPKQEDGNSTLALIVKMQADMAKVQADSQTSRETLMLKMMEMMNQKREETDTFDMQLDRMIKMKEFMGGESNGGGKRTTLETVLEYGAPVAIKVMDTIMGFVNVKNYAEGLKKQQIGGPISNPDVPPQTNPNPPQIEGENVIEMPQQQGPQGIPFAALIKGPVGPLVLDAMKRGETGDAFAESVVGMFGQLEYDKIAAIGKEAMLGSMKSVPEFWNQVVPSSIEKFVDEFIAYGSDEGVGDE